MSENLQLFPLVLESVIDFNKKAISLSEIVENIKKKITVDGNVAEILENVKDIVEKAVNYNLIKKEEDDKFSLNLNLNFLKKRPPNRNVPPSSNGYENDYSSEELDGSGHENIFIGPLEDATLGRARSRPKNYRSGSTTSYGRNSRGRSRSKQRKRRRRVNPRIPRKRTRSPR